MFTVENAGGLMHISSVIKLRLHIAVRALVWIALAMLATEREARAYTDPGSTALIWQMLVAGFAGLLFNLRRITSWFKNRKGPKD
jgi:hypothetical protein